MIKRLFSANVFFFLVCITFCFKGFAQEWTWIKGANTLNALGIYGLQGVPATGNLPGSREAAGTWTDNSGNLWMFGGNGHSAFTYGRLNDLWKFDPVTHNWTWVSGFNNVNQWGVYGTQGVASATNVPGARAYPVTWKDNSGNLWLFGGSGYDAFGNVNNLNDLWRYNIATNQWTWMGGSNTVNQYGVYGTQAVASATNIPGSRRLASGCTDNSGNFWLFGGYGYAVSGAENNLNDLWKFDPVANTWTWVKGVAATSQFGAYGSLGVGSATTSPGARHGARLWKDSGGTIWLFSGNGNASATSGFLNDIWKYDISTSQWIWVKGANVSNPVSVFGTQSVPSATIHPGGRYLTASWLDNNNNVYIQGGNGISLGGAQQLNDTWKFNIQTNDWTFVRGYSGQTQGVYGTQSVTATSSDPGSGNLRMSWTDNSGNFWLFGGSAYDVNANFGVLSDLWKMNPCLPPAPVNISQYASQNPCTGSAATLSAISHTNLVSWYASPTGTTALGTGTNYTSPSLTSGTAATASYTYYAASTNTCGTSAARTPIVVTSNSIYPVVTAGQVFTVGIALPNGSTPNSSWSPWVHTFSDPVPVGGVVIGFDLTCEVVDQGWGGTGVGADLHVADQRIAYPILTHSPVSHTLSTTAPFPNYVYGGNNTFKMYFAGWSGWQGFINNGYLVVRYQMKPSAPITVCQNSDFALKAYGADTYSWTGGVTDGVSFVPLSSQTYTVTGFNKYGCPNTAVQQLNVTPAPTVAIPAGTAICMGQSVSQTATVSGTSHTFSWSTGATALLMNATPTISTRYTAVAMNTITGCFHRISNKVNVNSVPVLSLTASSNSFCAGQTTSLSLSDAGKAYALQFDGVDDYIETNSNITELGDADFTIEAWVKTTAASQGIVVCENSNSVWEPGEKAFYINASGVPAFVGFGHNYILGSSSVNDGNWHHVAVVFDHTGGTSGVGKIYIDGSDQTASSTYSPYLENVGTFKIGAPNHNGYTPEAPNYFSGVIDDVRIWNVARSTTQVSSTMNTCLSTSETGLVAYYSFEDGAGSYLADRSINDNHGSLMSVNTTTAWVNGRSNCFSAYTSYVWSPGALTSSAIAVAPGSTTVYSVNVINSLQCSASVSTLVTVYPLPTVNVNSGAICTGKSYTITPSGANSYTFINGASVVTPSSTSSYSIIGESSLGCISANPGISNVTVNPLPVLSITGPNAVCSGSAISQVVSGATSYSWSNGSTGSVIAVSPTIATVYQVSGTITATGCSSSLTKTISVGMPPVITVNSGNVCAGSSYTLLPNGAATYTFSNGTNTISSVVTPSANASYFVTGSSSLGCVSSNTAIANVIVNAAPVIVVNSGAICSGQVFTLTPTGASTYTFSNGSPTVSPLAFTSYSVTGTNVQGCVSTVPGVAQVSVNANPVVSVTNTTVCEGSAVSLSPSGASSYTFMSPAGPVSAWVSPTVTTNYSVTGTSAAGCVSSNTAVLTVNVYSLPVISVSNGSVCSGGIYTLSPTGAVSYTFSSGSNTVAPSVNSSYSITGTSAEGCVSAVPAVAGVSILASPVVSVNSGVICEGSTFTLVPSGASTYTFSSLSSTVAPSSNTFYTVSGTSSQGCVSSNQAIANVVVNPGPQISIIGNAAICMGQSSQLNATGAVSYTWSTNTQGSSETVSPPVSTTFTVVGTAANTCTNSATVNLTVHPLPVISLNTGTVCPLSSFTIIPSGALSYQFSSGSPIVSPLVTTSYSVTGTDANGCSNVIPAVTTVSVINHISLTVSGNTVLCAGETTTLTAFGASSYMWSNNQFSSSIVTTPPASTVFTVIGADGTCLDTVLVALQVNALPSITASSASSVICAGESVSLSASGAGTYSWSSGESSAVISVSPPVNTTYTVTGTDENGCASMYTLLQVVNACVGITEPQRIVDLMQLYPNPNTGEFTIENSAEIHLKVINTLGQVVLEKDLDSGKNTIWLYEQPKGIYFVELKRAGAIKLIKIIKN